MDFCLIFSVGIGSGIGIKSMIFLVHFPGKSTKKWEKTMMGPCHVLSFGSLSKSKCYYKEDPNQLC